MKRHAQHILIDIFHSSIHDFALLHYADDGIIHIYFSLQSALPVYYEDEISFLPCTNFEEFPFLNDFIGVKLTKLRQMIHVLNALFLKQKLKQKKYLIKVK